MAETLLYLREKSTRVKAFLVALITGLFESVWGTLGMPIALLRKYLSPPGLAFASGAILFVISEEIITKNHSRDNGREAIIDVIIGFILMMDLM